MAVGVHDGPDGQRAELPQIGEDLVRLASPRIATMFWS